MVTRDIAVLSSWTPKIRYLWTLERLLFSNRSKVHKVTDPKFLMSFSVFSVVHICSNSKFSVPMHDVTSNAITYSSIVYPAVFCLYPIFIIFGAPDFIRSIFFWR